MEEFKSIEHKKISDFCECKIYEQLKHRNFNVKPKLLGFDQIKSDDLTFIEEFLQVLPNNTILIKLMQNEMSSKYFTIDYFISSIMRKSYESLLELGLKFLDGTIKLNKAEKLTIIDIGVFQIKPTKKKNWEDYLTILMKFVKMKQENIDKRIRQIKIYQKLGNTEEILKLVLAIKEKNDLVGNFTLLEELEESLRTKKYSGRLINEIIDRMIKIYQQLEEINNQNFKICIKSYLDHYEFIEWFKKNVPNLGALKLLCEFASESENEGALEVVRVQSLPLVGTAL